MILALWAVFCKENLCYIGSVLIPLPGANVTIPPPFLGFLCLIGGLALTFALRIQRRRLANQVWDLITLACFVGAAWWLNIWDPLSNLVVGLLAGLAAVVIRDVRLWAARLSSKVYRRTHRYHWYGRARNWYGRRRRR